MLLLPTDKLPDDPAKWEYQLKLDGYRAIAFKSDDRVHLRSRNDNDFTRRYPAVVRGLGKLPNDTVIDGEVVALGEDGRPSFNTLQNSNESQTPIVYYVFDVIVLAGRDLSSEPLSRRRALLEEHRLVENDTCTGGQTIPCDCLAPSRNQGSFSVLAVSAALAFLQLSQREQIGNICHC